MVRCTMCARKYACRRAKLLQVPRVRILDERRELLHGSTDVDASCRVVQPGIGVGGSLIHAEGSAQSTHARHQAEHAEIKWLSSRHS